MRATVNQLQIPSRKSQYLQQMDNLPYYLSGIRYAAFCISFIAFLRMMTSRKSEMDLNIKLQLVVLEGLEYSDSPESYAGGSLTTGRVSHAGEVLVGCSSPVTNRGCNFSPSMNSTPSITNAASVDAQSKKDRVPGLGRGLGSITNLRSPNSLKILQFNINGISTSASRIKLDQVLELALTEGAQIIARQETMLKTFTSLKIKGYNIFRKITDGSNLEIQGIRIIWRGKPLNIFNMYHPPDLKSLPTDLQDLFTVGTICISDLNAKHPIWGCSTVNLRGNELLDIIDDKCFSILNDGTATHFSYSYNTKEALDISITSSDLGPSCKWTLLENLGSDHLPILIELKKRQLVPTSNNKQCIFKKADWQSFAEAVDYGIKSIPDSVDFNWCSLKEMILRAAKK
ncbi:RNA-directed DNA polymerase from mobile element jockey [Trichonephila clavipes]|nr:RNA-directed DNA polymerase from mobile element jockey [Trichonephila clavipes]